VSGSTFFERIDLLAEEVGDDHLIGACEVDQVYAHRQHEELTWRHPEGGQAKYLEQPFLDGAEDHVRRLAKTLLDPGGPTVGMTEIVEEMARDVFEHAPFEFGDLRASGHPFVVDGGRILTGENGKSDIAGGHNVYDRPPAVHRLSEDELRAKGDLRRLGLGHG
jgi:hypothetical protein